MKVLYSKCNLCPHKCNVDRSKVLGRCKANDKIKIGLYDLYYNEEPCISGKKGSGAIFFSCCNLKCVFCQNYEISYNNSGKYVSVNELANIMIELQDRGALNINLVSPTIYVDKIIEAIDIARDKGLNLPIVYNSSGYENIDTLKKLNGYVDVYLPDFKYGFDDIAFKYSNVLNYVSNCINSIKEMLFQVGNLEFDSNGIVKKGVLIRHLILPNNVKNSKKVLDLIYDNFGNYVYLSIMAQYFPTHKAKEFEEINRKINKEELDEVYDYLENYEFFNGYIQELGEHEEEYVPDFNLKE